MVYSQKTVSWCRYCLNLPTWKTSRSSSESFGIIPGVSLWVQPQIYNSEKTKQNNKTTKTLETKRLTWLRFLAYMFVLSVSCHIVVSADRMLSQDYLSRVDQTVEAYAFLQTIKFISFQNIPAPKALCVYLQTLVIVCVCLCKT